MMAVPAVILSLWLRHLLNIDSIQVLISQLKDVAPTIQKSISELTDEVNGISSNLPPVMKLRDRSNSPIQAKSKRTLENGTDEVAELASRMSSVHLEKASASPTLKLPPLFSSTSNSSGKGGNMQKRHPVALVNPIEAVTEKLSLEQHQPKSHLDNPLHEEAINFLQNLKKSVREAALSSQSCNFESSQDSRSDDSSEHYFVPLSGIGFSHLSQDKQPNSLKNRQLLTSQMDSSLLQTCAVESHLWSKYSSVKQMINDLESLDEFDGVNGFLSAVGSNSSHRSFYDVSDTQDEVFSPPLLMDTALSGDSYEDLLAPLSETETALMEY